MRARVARSSPSCGPRTLHTNQPVEYRGRRGVEDAATQACGLFAARGGAFEVTRTGTDMDAVRYARDRWLPGATDPPERRVRGRRRVSRRRRATAPAACTRRREHHRALRLALPGPVSRGIRWGPGADREGVTTSGNPARARNGLRAGPLIASRSDDRSRGGRTREAGARTRFRATTPVHRDGVRPVLQD